MKRLLVFLVAALVAVSTSAVAADKVLRIPFSTAFSGPYVAFGERLWRGGNIAVDEINAAGGVRGGYKMEFYKVDTRGIDVAPFMADFKRICKDDKNKIMLGNMSSKKENNEENSYDLSDVFSQQPQNQFSKARYHKNPRARQIGNMCSK